MPVVVVVRHALSVWNMEGRWQGHADPPLSAAGLDQAERAAAAVEGVDLVVTSDLERARRTGAVLAPRAAATTCTALREFDVGAWSGLTRPEIEARWPDQLAAFDAGRLDSPPGGEGRGAFEARVATAARAVAGIVRRRSSQRSLVVTHGGVVRALARMQGLGDHHVGHLCGYQAEVKGDDLALVAPVDLLGPPRRPARAVDPVAL